MGKKEKPSEFVEAIKHLIYQPTDRTTRQLEITLKVLTAAINMKDWDLVEAARECIIGARVCMSESSRTSAVRMYCGVRGGDDD